MEKRGTTYGDSEFQYKLLAERWSSIVGVPLTPAQTILMMMDLKLVRSLSGKPSKDTVDDIIGYACLLGKELKV